MSEEDKLVNISEKVIVLKGIIQTFDNTYHSAYGYIPAVVAQIASNGRIYSSSVFLNEIKRMRPKMRISKIKRIFPDNKL